MSTNLCKNLFGQSLLIKMNCGDKSKVCCTGKRERRRQERAVPVIKVKRLTDGNH